jgi:hypothetical protein
MNRPRFGLLALLLLAGAGSAFAQDPPKPDVKPEAKPDAKPDAKPEVKPEVKPDGEHPVIHIPLPGAQDDLQQQMVKLFGEVETRLREIDKLLSEAAAGQRGAQDAQKPLEKAAAGIGALVQKTQDEGKAVVAAIDKILDLAQQQEQQQGQGQGNGQGSSGGRSGDRAQPGEQQGEQQGKSPLEGQRDTTTQRESTPDKPGSEKGQQPQGKQADRNGSPKGNQKSNQDPKNSTSKNPPSQETEKTAHGPDSRENWGYLPEHARDVFRTQGGGQMPARYREWIDAYYKRLNQKP